MIQPVEIMGSVTTEEVVRQKARRTILAHDPQAHDIVEMLLGEKE
jgi:hypothetical protein